VAGFSDDGHHDVDGRRSFSWPASTPSGWCCKRSSILAWFGWRLFGVVFSVIGAFYYLRVVKCIYFDKPEQSEPISISRMSKLSSAPMGYC
jgi:hypothetical protein